MTILPAIEQRPHRSRGGLPPALTGIEQPHLLDERYVVLTRKAIRSQGKPHPRTRYRGSTTSWSRATPSRPRRCIEWDSMRASVLTLPHFGVLPAILAATTSR